MLRQCVKKLEEEKSSSSPDHDFAHVEARRVSNSLQLYQREQC